MLSHNKILSLNRTFADAHHVIKNFEHGEGWHIGLHKQQATFKYPLFFLENQPHSISESGRLSMNYKAYFLTRVPTLKRKVEVDESLRSNIAEAHSDMEQCAMDLLSYWAQDTTETLLTVDRAVSISLLTWFAEDYVCGASMDLKLIQPFKFNSCIIPI